MKKSRICLVICGSVFGTSSAFVGPCQQGRDDCRALPFPSKLNTVTVVSEPDQGFTIVRIGSKRAKPNADWRKRLVNKFRREKKLQGLSFPLDDDGTFLTENFNNLVPSDVLPLDLIAGSTLNRKSRRVGVEGISREQANLPLEHESSSSPLLGRMTGAWAEKLLATLVHRWTEGSHENLQIRCDPNGGAVDLVKGLFRADATIEFDKLVFGAIRMSKGKLESRRLALNLYKYAPFCKKIPRFTKAFDLNAYDITFSQEDLFESNCVRQGLRRLLRNILCNRGMESSNVSIDSIQVLPSGKLSISGSCTTLFDSKVTFNVRSGLGVTNRGHVLTFPGLEISLSPAVGLFLPVVPTISLDLGHNAIITDVGLNGDDKTLRLSCRVTITPRHTRKLIEYEQTTNAFAASFHFDVGRWLTRIGNFSS